MKVWVCTIQLTPSQETVYHLESKQLADRYLYHWNNYFRHCQRRCYVIFEERIEEDEQ